MNIQRIIETLNNFQDVDDEKQMDGMIEAVAQLSESPQAAAAEALFRVCERFPEHDGYETFWSILHTLEATPDYEPELVKSIMRQPNEFNVLMINRMLNVGIRDIGDTDLVGLLRQAAQDERTPASVRENAEEFIQTHETSAADGGRP